MLLPFVDRDPTPREIEKLRLVLSTYQDGTGMLESGTLPGWRDFERTVALVFGGEAQESKFIFDVLLPAWERPEIRYGLSCKMRKELNRLQKVGRVTIELSNSAGKFWDHLNAKGIDQTNYRQRPLDVGKGLIEVIEGWYSEVSLEKGGVVDLARSSHLVLLWNNAGWYQLHQFPLEFRAPQELKWHCPSGRNNQPSRRIVGEDDSGVLFEWYGESGGQLKYYPRLEDARWSSELFRLEPIAEIGENVLLEKTAKYFPKLWSRLFEENHNEG